MARIDKGIPIPPARGGVGAHKTGRKWPFAELGIGDSFLMPGVKASVASANGNNVARETGRKFTVRVVDGGTRVWRIE